MQKSLRLSSYLLLLIAVFLLGSCSSDEAANIGTDNEQQENTLPLEAAISFDVAYGENPQQTYDLYLPAARSSAKTMVIVLIHGGSWVAGDKSDMQAYVESFRALLPDYAVVNLNYVLANESTPAFPNQFLDVKTALDQLKDQATELQILPEFALIGVSAGAHISLMTDYVYDPQDLIKMVCSIVGPTDFTDPFYSNSPEYQILLNALVDEAAYAADTNYAVATSPVHQVSSASAPTIMFYGNSDPIVPLTNGESLAEVLADNSISHSFTIYEGGHGDDWSEENYSNLQNLLVDYLLQHLPVKP